MAFKDFSPEKQRLIKLILRGMVEDLEDLAHGLSSVQELMEEGASESNDDE